MNNYKIEFSFNWNNKLNCNVFTSIRLLNWNKYRTGRLYDIYLKKEFIKSAYLVEIRTFKLSSLDDFICLLDTGYVKKTTIDIIRKMYKTNEFDDSKEFMLLFFKTLN